VISKLIGLFPDNEYHNGRTTEALVQSRVEFLNFLNSRTPGQRESRGSHNATKVLVHDLGYLRILTASLVYIIGFHWGMGGQKGQETFNRESLLKVSFLRFTCSTVLQHLEQGQGRDVDLLGRVHDGGVGGRVRLAHPHAGCVHSKKSIHFFYLSTLSLFCQTKTNKKFQSLMNLLQ
jgi:hypothetical protein